MAINELEQALRVAREQGDRAEEGRVLHKLGATHLAAGNLVEAKTCCEAAYQRAQEVGDWSLTGFVLRDLGCVEEGLGQDEEASISYISSFRCFEGLGNPLEVARSRWACGGVYVRQGKRQTGIKMMAESAASEQEMGDPQAEEHLALVEHLRAGGNLPM